MTKKYLAAYGMYPTPLTDEIIEHLAKFDLLDIDFQTGPDLPRIRACLLYTSPSPRDRS